MATAWRQTRMRRAAVLVAVTMAFGALVACGEAAAPGSPTDSTNPGGANPGAAPGSSGSQIYRGVGTVLESPDHGPQLCLGGVAESYPPQCSGPDLVGWDWSTVTGAESANGSTWGMYAVSGTWADGRMTVTAVGAPEDVAQEPMEDPNLASPCEPPAGGWAVVDEATATDDAMYEALAAAATEADFAGSWLDQSINPAWDDPNEPNEEMLLNDPTKLVLNVMFTGDLERHESELRAIWGGALCVSAAPRSEADLIAIQMELTDEPGVLGSGPNPRAGTLEVSVIMDDGLQARMDETYGEGVVVVIPSLQPVD